MKVVPLIMVSVGTEQVRGSQRNQTMDEKGGQAGQSTGGRATEGRWQQGEEGAVGLMRAVLLFLLFSC